MDAAATASPLIDQRADALSHHHALNVAALIEVEDDDRQVVLAAKRDGGGIHYPQPQPQHVHVADLVEHGGVLYQHRIVGVDSVNLGGLQDGLCLDLHGTQRSSGIGGKIGIAGAAGEDHDAVFFQTANGAATDKGLSHLVHLDRGHKTGEDVLLLQGVLQGKSIDDSSQHAHVI